MAKSKAYGVLTLQLMGRDAGLSGTMNKAGKATKRFTGTIDGLNNTYSNLSSKLGLVAGAMTLASKMSTGLVQAFGMLGKEGDEFTESTFKFQELLTTLPLGLGEAARATFEFGDAIGLTSAESWKELKRVEAAVKDVRSSLVGLHGDVHKETMDIRERTRLTDAGLTDDQIRAKQEREALVELAADRGGAAFDRAWARIEGERDRITKELQESGMEWGDAWREAERQVKAVERQIIDNERAKVELARSQLARDKDTADKAHKERKRAAYFSTFKDQLQWGIEQRMGKGAAAGMAALEMSDAELRSHILVSYNQAVRIAQREQQKLDLANRMGVSVADLVQELDPKEIQKRIKAEGIGFASMADLDDRAGTEFGRMLIAAEHLAKLEADRQKQELEAADLADRRAKQQQLEAKQTKELTALTRNRAAAERELLNVQRMAMGDQFTFQGVIGTMRIADRADTSRLQQAHTEALAKVNRTLLDINGQLQGMAT
tara:strand:+ start:7908 stop:9380 length:1473 start_codon:yes stop_codon:yes gene_type:complete